MKLTINKDIDVEFSNRELSKLLMNWFTENSLGTSDCSLDYFVEDGCLYEGENGTYSRYDAVFITDDKQVIDLFNSIKFLSKMK